jgi:Zn-dependent peptidase ImmA (M78 family)/transcriptional regulator with XRE-family HTH domain
MRIGVENFIGERLTEAREAKGILTMTSLADLLEKSKNLISLYESNKAKPSPQMVALMADKLGVKESFFLMPIPKRKANPIFSRSRHNSTKHTRTVIERKFGWSKWLIDVYLKSFMDMPELNIPNRKELGVPNDIRELTPARIEEIAQRCRDFWGLGIFPIDNVTLLLENNGILITCGFVDSDKIDAFSNISEYDGSLHMFLGLDKGSAMRSRFDASHELAHLLLHSHLSDKQISDKIHRLLEDQANRFASAFLLPAASFKKDVWMTTIEAFKILKKDWKASVGAIIKRCDDLGLLGEDESKARRLWIEYRKEWKEIEEDNLPFEQPLLMQRCIDALLESGIKTKSQILYELPFSRATIESLLNLPDGYLSENYGELKHFPTIKENASNTQFSGGQVIQFSGRNKAS